VSNKALVLLVVVCSAFSAEAKEWKRSVSLSSDSRRDVAQATGPLDACALIQKADVDAAFVPRVFGNGEKQQGYVAGTAKLASVSGCTFTSRGASVREMMTAGVVVRRAPNDKTGVTVAQAKEGAVKLIAQLKLDGAPVDVAGLGDAAYWINLGSSARPAIELNVFKGKRLWIVYSSSAPKGGAELALANLTKLAKATQVRF
jgi:hypothetical protein